MKPLESIINTLHQLIARHAAQVFECARLLGFAVPVAWDFGLKYARDYTQVPGYASPPRDGAWYRFTLRANDVTWDVITFVPNLDDSGGTLAEVSRRWERCVADLIRGAEALVHVWIDKHPEALGGDPKKMLAKLDSLKTSDTAIDDWSSKVAETAKNLIYRRIQ